MKTTTIFTKAANHLLDRDTGDAERLRDLETRVAVPLRARVLTGMLGAVGAMWASPFWLLVVVAVTPAKVLAQAASLVRARRLVHRMRVEYEARQGDPVVMAVAWSRAVSTIEGALHDPAGNPELLDACAREVLVDTDMIAWTGYLSVAEGSLYVSRVAELGDDAPVNQIVDAMFEPGTIDSRRWGAGISTEVLKTAIKEVSLAESDAISRDPVAAVRRMVYVAACELAVADGIVDPQENAELQRLRGLLRPAVGPKLGILATHLRELEEKCAQGEQLWRQAQVADMIRRGQLPVLDSRGMNLRPGEQLHHQEKSERKGIRRTAEGRGLDREEFEVMETLDTGDLLVTSTAATFSGRSGAKDLRLRGYVTVETYRDALRFVPRRGKPFFVTTAMPLVVLALLEILEGGQPKGETAPRAGMGWCLEILELEGIQPLTAAAIKAAHRTIAAKHHPDRGGRPSYFRLITEARDILLAQVARS